MHKISLCSSSWRPSCLTFLPLMNCHNLLTWRWKFRPSGLCQHQVLGLLWKQKFCSAFELFCPFAFRVHSLTSSLVLNGRIDARLGDSYESGNIWDGGFPASEIWVPPIWVEGSIRTYGDFTHKNFRQFSDIDRGFIQPDSRVACVTFIFLQLKWDNATAKKSLFLQFCIDYISFQHFKVHPWQF